LSSFYLEVSIKLELETVPLLLTAYIDGDATPVRGRYLIVWRQEEDGTWRVDRNMFHFITPAPF